MLTKTSLQNYPEENLISLPPEAMARFGRGGVSATAVSPDANMIAVASRIGVWIYNVNTEEFIRLIAVEDTGLLSDVTFSPDGTQIATGDWDGITSLWDVDTGANLGAYTNTNYVTSVTFSPNGKLLASGTRNGKVFLWDIITDEAYLTISHDDYVSSVAFSPDGLLMATASWDGIVNLWDIDTGKIRWCFSHKKKESDIKFESGQTISFDNGEINCIAFSPNGKLFASAEHVVDNRDARIVLWNVQTGNPIWGFTHKKSATSITFSRDNKYIAFHFSKDCTDVRCIVTGTSVTNIDEIRIDEDIKDIPLTHPNSWYSWLVSFSSDGRNLVGMSEVSAIKVWDVEYGKDIKIIDRDIGQAKDLTYSTEGNIIGLSRTEDTATLLIDEIQKAVFAHQTEVVSAAISQNGKIAATGGLDNNIKLWNTETEEHLHTLTGHIGAVYDLTFSPDDTLLASGGGRNFEMEEDNGIIYFTTSEESPVDQTAKIWEINTRKEIVTLEHASLVRVVTFSPDNTLLATTSENEVNLWDTKSWQKIMKLETVRVESFVFSKDSSFLAIGGRGRKPKIQIWNVKTAQLVVEFSGHKSDVESVAFSPDDTLLASGGFDGVIYLWDMKPYLKKTGIF